MSTLANAERHWAPVVRVVMGLCIALGLALVGTAGAALAQQGATWPAWTLWTPCLLVWGALTASNVVYLLRHGHTTVGMMPVSVVSLLPAALPALAVADVHPAARVAATCALVLAAGVLALLAWWFCRLRAAYASSPPVPPGATVIVLGGAVRKGVPCHTLVQRLDTASRLYQEDKSVTLVLTGGPVRGERVTEAEAMARYLEERGVPRDALVLEQHARNTQENIALSLALAQQRGLCGRLCVLTSDYHLYRAVQNGRRLGVSLVPLAAPTPCASRLQQWSREVLTILNKGA